MPSCSDDDNPFQKTEWTRAAVDNKGVAVVQHINFLSESEVEFYTTFEGNLYGKAQLGSYVIGRPTIIFHVQPLRYGTIDESNRSVIIVTISSGEDLPFMGK